MQVFDRRLLAICFSGLMTFSAQAKDLWALPKAAGAKPALLILPGPDGIDSYVHREAEKWSEEGFAVLVVDFYDKENLTRSESRRLWEKMDSERAFKKAQDSLRSLKKSARTDPTRMGVMSFGASGGILFRLLGQNPKLRVGVLLEPTPLLNRELLKTIKSRMLLIYGTGPQGFSEKTIAKFEEMLSDLKLIFEIKKYPGAGRGFMDYTHSESFQAVPAEKARQDLQLFLQRFLSLENPIKY